MTVTGDTVTGATGLAVHPVSGQFFVIVRLGSDSAGPDRHLGIVDPATGAVTIIGTTASGLAGLTFDCAGTLYGVTGDGNKGGVTPETLFTINPATGAATLVGALGNGSDGEAIAFNPTDNMMYHASGHTGVCAGAGSGVCFERFDPTVTPLAPTNIDISMTALINEEAQALAFEASSGMFLWKQDHGTGPLFRVNPMTGAATLIGMADMDHQAKGLAFVGGTAACGPAPASDFSIGPTAQVPLITVRPGQTGTFSVVINPIPAGTVFASQVDVTCATSPFVGTCSVNPSTIAAGSGATTVTVTVTPTIFGGAPPFGGNPAPWLWLAAFALSLVAAGIVGRRRLPRLGYATTFGALLLLVSVVMLQSSCAGSTGQRLQGPYQVTVTATSGGTSHSTAATYNVSK